MKTEKQKLAYKNGLINQVRELRRENRLRFENIHNKDVFKTFGDPVNIENEKKCHLMIVELRYDFDMSHDDVMAIF